MKELDLNTLKKDCPICTQTLPLSEFGICRARKDGRNLYCKSCIRKKVTDSRRALREYKSVRKRYADETSQNPSLALSEAETASSVGEQRILRKLSPLERVKEAIRNGARTQKEIRKAANLSDDEVGDALANLLLWTREIRTELKDNNRVYFLNEIEPISYRDEPLLPRRKPDVPSSFSALQGLMPGRNPEGETEKIGGWVAA